MGEIIEHMPWEMKLFNSYWYRRLKCDEETSENIVDKKEKVKK